MHRHRGRGRRNVVAVVLLAAVAVGCSSGKAPEHPNHDGDRVTQWLDRLLPWGLRGAVGVVDGDRVVVGAGLGDGIDLDTRFGIGSNTKPLTALTVLILEDRGQLDVDDRLGDLLPDVPEDKAAITVRQLLTHTAGFESTHGSDDEQIDRAEALRRIYAQHLLFRPGEGSSYSNSGYTLLAAVVEEVAGRPFDDFLRAEVFRPGGMTHSGFQGGPVPAGEHEASGDSASHLPPVGWALRGAGGVVASVSDLVALERAIADGGLLSGKARRRWNAPLVGAAGYGFVFDELAPGVRIRAHGGDVPELHHTNLWAHELTGDGHRTLVVSSADAAMPAEDLARPIYRLLEGDHVAAPPALRPVDAGELARVAGRYRAAGGATITVEARRDDLRLSSEDGRAFGDLFPLPDPIDGIAPIDQVVRLVEALDDPGYRQWLAEQTTELGSLAGIEPVGVVPGDAAAPQTYLRHRFARGSVLTAWEFSPQGEAESIDLGPRVPGVTVRPAAAGGFAAFSLTGTPLPKRVSFDGDGVMTIHIGKRVVEYRRDG